MELQFTPAVNSLVPTKPVFQPSGAAGGVTAPEQSESDDNTPTRSSSDRPVQGALESELTPEEQRKLQELRQRDTEVRNHEQAHVAAGGQYVTRAPTYDYEIGPDGRRYAVGGEVNIDVSKVPDDPEATIEKAQVVQRAALAPVDPSPQDRQVASDAAVMERDARAELREQRMEEMRETMASSPDTAEQPPTTVQATPSVSGDAPTAVDPPQIKTSTLSAADALEQRIADFFVGPPSHLSVLV